MEHSKLNFLSKNEGIFKAAFILSSCILFLSFLQPLTIFFISSPVLSCLATHCHKLDFSLRLIPLMPPHPYEIPCQQVLYNPPYHCHCSNDKQMPDNISVYSIRIENVYQTLYLPYDFIAAKMLFNAISTKFLKSVKVIASVDVPIIFARFSFWISCKNVEFKRTQKSTSPSCLTLVCAYKNLDKYRIIHLR